MYNDDVRPLSARGMAEGSPILESSPQVSDAIALIVKLGKLPMIINHSPSAWAGLAN